MQKGKEKTICRLETNKKPTTKNVSIFADHIIVNKNNVIEYTDNLLEFIAEFSQLLNTDLIITDQKAFYTNL